MRAKNDFNKEEYLAEMEAMVDRALTRLKNEQPEFKVYTICIWTDPEAIEDDYKAYSSIGFDNLENSLKLMEQRKEYWRKHNWDDIDESETRIYNPADLYYTDYEVLEHMQILNNWRILGPLLSKIGKYTIEKVKELRINIDNDMELTLNTKNDWCGKIMKMIK